MINKILADIEELKNQVDDIQSVLLSMNARLNELEMKTGLMEDLRDGE